MTVEAITLVLHHSQAAGTAKVVLIGIANHDGDGGSWPGVDTLVKYARKSERAVQYALRELEEIGEIRVHLNGGGTHNTRKDQRPNRYEILLACPPDCDGTTAHRVKPPAPRGDGSGVQSAAPRGATSFADGVQPTAPEPSLEPSKEPTPDPLFAGGTEDEFELWWRAYPRKTDKTKARRAYAARRREGNSAGALAQGRDGYIASREATGTELKYYKHGASLLAKDGPWTEYLDGDPVAEHDDGATTLQQLSRGQQWAGGEPT